MGIEVARCGDSSRPFRAHGMTWMEASTCHSEPSEGGRHMHLRRTAGAVQVGIPEARLQRPRRAWGVQGIFLPTEARFASTCLTRLGNPPRISTQIAQPGERPGRAGHRRGKSRTPCRPGTKLSGSKDPGWPALWKVVRHRRGKSRPGKSREGRISQVMDRGAHAVLACAPLSSLEPGGWYGVSAGSQVHQERRVDSG